MIISCCICCDSLLPDNVLLHLECGHIFHGNCLTEWLERSKTCPQCRKKTFKPTRVYPNFTTSCMDEVTGQLLHSEKERYQLNLASKEVDIAIMEATSRIASTNYSKETTNLRNEIIILEQRIKDLLFEMSAAKLTETLNVQKLLLLEMENLQIDFNGRTELIESYKIVNSELKVRQNEIEAENDLLREHVRMLLTIYKDVTKDVLTNQHQESGNIVIDVDDSDDDCVIVEDPRSVNLST